MTSSQSKLNDFFESVSWGLVCEVTDEVGMLV